MLRSKLKMAGRLDLKCLEEQRDSQDLRSTSEHFATPFWAKFYDIECALNTELQTLQFEPKITHIYNPIEYASDLHCNYLQKFLKGPKNVMLVGMNPGPNGMAQTGVPFGNIITVRDWMGLRGTVNQPENTHRKRPVTGLSCYIDEPSGVRFWSIIKNLAGSLEVFSKQCFMHNFCPLAFFNSAGQNITPSELKGNEKKKVRDICLQYFEQEIELVRPSFIVAVGNYVDECLRALSKQAKYNGITFLKLPHPSPRSVNNNNWHEKAQIFFVENDLVKYLQNQV